MGGLGKFMVEFIKKPEVMLEDPAGDSSSGAPAPVQLKHAVNIPGYTILSKLGERASSTVWQARQESLNRLVAIKILKKQYSSNQQDVDDFVNEAKAVAKLKSPNIIQVYDVGSHKDTFYFVMEYIEGQTLNHLLKTERYLPQKKALVIAAAVANALEEAWNKEKIVHRDIKPENIMLENDGSIKVSNLGLAGIIKSHADVSESNDDFIGTPNYMSPEQIDNSREVDFRSDMYSLGATLYHMLTGQMPFAGKKNSEIISAHKFEQLACPSDLKQGITTGCSQLITRLMMKEPKYRCKDWVTVYRDLDKLASGKIVVTKIVASAVSTIAKPGKAAVPVKSSRPLAMAEKKHIPPDKRKLKELKNKYSKKRAPSWLRMPLEVLMLIWFGWLGYQLIWLPLDIKLPQILKTDKQVEQEPGQEINDPSENQYTPTPVTTTQPEKRPPSRSSTPTNSSEPVPDVIPKTEVISDMSVPAVSLPKLKNDIVDRLLKNDVSGAVTLLKDSYPNGDESAEVSELAEILSSSNIRKNAVAASFENNIGKRINIIYRGQRKRIIVKSVSGQMVYADMCINTGSSETLKPIEFKVSQLDPKEQSRQIGKPSSPDLAVAKFLLHMNAGDYINARALADKCGPLSNACIIEVDAKVKMIMQ